MKLMKTCLVIGALILSTQAAWKEGKVGSIFVGSYNENSTGNDVIFRLCCSYWLI